MDKALAAANLKPSAEPRQPMRVLRYQPGCARELLCRCKYFEVYRMLVNTERRQKVAFRAGPMSFRVLLCVDGCGTLGFGGNAHNLYKGDCVFVPADSVELSLHGQLQLLDIRG